LPEGILRPDGTAPDIAPDPEKGRDVACADANHSRRGFSARTRSSPTMQDTVRILYQTSNNLEVRELPNGNPRRPLQAAAMI
jgi:hypothetical protein